MCERVWIKILEKIPRLWKKTVTTVGIIFTLTVSPGETNGSADELKKVAFRITSWNGSLTSNMNTNHCLWDCETLVKSVYSFQGSARGTQDRAQASPSKRHELPKLHHDLELKPCRETVANTIRCLNLMHQHRHVFLFINASQEIGSHFSDGFCMTPRYYT